MERFVLTDDRWARMEPHCLGKPTDPGRSGTNNRLFLEAVLWIVRTGSPWRDVPAMFGNWSTAFRRFRDWRAAADRFGVSASSAIRWRQLALQHGPAVTKRRGGDRHSGRIEEHGGFIRELVAEQGDMTLVEIQARLVERSVSIAIAIGTLHRFFVRHAMTRKKKTGTQSSKTAQAAMWCWLIQASARMAAIIVRRFARQCGVGPPKIAKVLLLSSTE